MRCFMRMLFVGISLIAFNSALSVNAQNAQNSDGCVNCVPAPPGFICQAKPYGGEACITSGESCTVTVPCPGLNCGAFAEKAKVEISNETIRAIAGVNPRFALVLITLRNLAPINLSQGKVNYVAVEMDETDVEWRLTSSEKSKDYFIQFTERMRQVYEKGISPGVYAFSITPGANAGSFTLRIEVEEAIANDPKHSSIDLNLTTSASATQKDFKLLQASTWEIK